VESGRKLPVNILSGAVNRSICSTFAVNIANCKKGAFEAFQKHRWHKKKAETLSYLPSYVMADTRRKSAVDQEILDLPNIEPTAVANLGSDIDFLVHHSCLPQYSDPWHANKYLPEGLRATCNNTRGNRL